MVELSNEMLETYGMTRYKSITIKDDPEALAYPPMSGSRSAGSTQDQGGDRRRGSGLRLLPASGQRPGRESFVLFKVNSKGTITLVYIEGELDSDDLITLLFTKKDL